MSYKARIREFEAKVVKLKNSIKNIPDFPKPGILFRDVSSLCQDKDAFALSIDMLYEAFKDEKIDMVVAAEARGFVFGAPLAQRLHAGFCYGKKTQVNYRVQRLKRAMIWSTAQVLCR